MLTVEDAATRAYAAGLVDGARLDPMEHGVVLRGMIREGAVEPCDASPAGLRHTRKDLGLTQAQMGLAMGLSLRAYQDLEGGLSRVRKIHIMAARLVVAERRPR